MNGYIEMKKQDTRPCLICYPRDTRGNGKWQKAYFHMWRKREARYIGEEKEVLEAVVEMEDGFVMTIEPGYMRFADRDKSEFEINSDGKDNEE